MMDRLYAAIAGNTFRHSHRASLENQQGLNERLLFIFNFARTLALFVCICGGCGCFVIVAVFIYSFYLTLIDVIVIYRHKWIHLQGCHRSMEQYVETVSRPTDFICEYKWTAANFLHFKRFLLL